MDENSKHLFDSFHKLSEQSWRDWDHKSRHEWRLSFGIWGALLAACAAKAKVTVSVPAIVPFSVGALVATTHVFFQWWIQRALTQYRNGFWDSHARMREIVALPVEVPSRRPWWRHPSVWTQTTITLLLVLVTILLWLS